MRPDLEFLLSAVYDDAGLNPEHRADLRKSGLTDDTVRAQRLRSVPPAMIQPLLSLDVPAVRSALLFPFPDARGGWLDFVRVKVFPSIATPTGTIKYLQPRRTGSHLFFPLATLAHVLSALEPLWLCEGEKKALAVAQLGLPAIGFCGIQGWRIGGTRQLLSEFDLIPLAGRLVELVPDGDVQTNPAVARGAEQFAEALTDRGAVVRLVQLPHEVAA